MNLKHMVAMALMVGALVLSTAVIALADEGGVPDPNADLQTGQGNPHGRKGAQCTVPGATIFRETAKQPGPNNNLFGEGVTPGQVVDLLCTPNPQRE
jgi:hypothetical protein